MYVQPGEWSNPGGTHATEARSIGAILGGMRAIALLRARGPGGRTPAPRTIAASA
jgi:hypothetical protein